MAAGIAPEEKSKALDRIALAVVQNRGKIPDGIFTTIAKEHGITRGAVWEWWHKALPDEARKTLLDTHARRREAWRKEALDFGRYLTESIARDIKAGDDADPDDEHAPRKTTVKEKVMAARACREIADGEREPTEAFSNIKIAIDMRATKGAIPPPPIVTVPADDDG